MKVQEIQKQHPLYEKYRQFLVQHSPVYGNESWQNLYEGLNLHTCALLNNNDEIQGGFVYYTFTKWKIVKCAITPPYMPSIDLVYVNRGETIVSRNSAQKEMLECIADYFSSKNFDLVELAFDPGNIDTQPFSWKGFKSLLRYTYHLSLLPPTEDLWQQLSSEKRKSINKAQKDGLQVRKTSDFETVKELVLATLSRNAAQHNKDILHRLLSSEYNNVLVAFATQDTEGNILAVNVSVNLPDRFVYLFGGSSQQHRHHGAGVACMWQAILAAKEMGKRVFDFEGSMHPGIERYYREFGGQLVAFPEIVKRSFLLEMYYKLRK